MSEINDQEKTRLADNPEGFIEETIKKVVFDSSANRLAGFGNEPIFEEPLIGFAAGDDPLFDEYKKVVHEDHFAPREILTRHLVETLKIENPQFENVSVISFVLPVHRETLRSNASEKAGPSLRWNHTRWKGQDFINTLSSDLAALLQALGISAVAPETSPYFKIMVTPGGFPSNWSQRHIAYAAGLGTFSLNEGFITAKGMAMRLGSVVVDLKLKPSARPYAHYRSNCLFYAGEKCGRCITRCPGGALSDKGHDKIKCYRVLYEQQAPWIKGEHGPGFIGKYAGCGLCQTGVPCANRIPEKNK